MADRWYALTHGRGPALSNELALHLHPDFMKHVQFLDSLERAGMLVASGPIAGERDSSMTVLRLTEAHGPIDVERMVTEEDPLVVDEIVSVDVRPWGVMRATV